MCCTYTCLDSGAGSAECCNDGSGFYLEILFWGGNTVDNDSKKGHNTLLCTVGAFTIILPYNLGGKHVFLGGETYPGLPPPLIKPCGF